MAPLDDDDVDVDVLRVNSRLESTVVGLVRVRMLGWMDLSYLVDSYEVLCICTDAAGKEREIIKMRNRALQPVRKKIALSSKDL